ncbi:hypothetical protein [Streptomyces chryseus]|uniref:hypothetical protein n=1 Tax=Streptomyces chryseus TaxID=68186 RepID=UPI0019A8F69D|nr:hypothetical protein [Streptomyces chryseus]GGX36921.1 hypothetical protein GCM10010353_60080 [Streptomyces chryseus]
MARAPGVGFLLTGALAVGAAVAGLLGEVAGVRATLWVGGVFLATAFLPVSLSPARTRRALPRQHEPPGPEGPRAPGVPAEES